MSRLDDAPAPWPYPEPRDSSLDGVGVPLQAEIGAHRMPITGRRVLDATNAAAEVLALYLSRLEWQTGGGTGPDDRWRLNQVFPGWPDPDQPLPYPCASIDAEAAERDAHDLVPTMLEETCGQYGEGTVLWKTSEVVVEQQVDFWLTSEAERKAVMASLPAYFSPSEGRAGVLLSGHPDYYDRAVNVLLLSHDEIDTSESRFERERRIRCLFACEIEEVHLRRVVRLDPVPVLASDP